MAPQDNQLPEGTDHIINGAMETGGGSAGIEGGGAGAGRALCAGTSAGEALGWFAAAGAPGRVSGIRGSRRPNRFSPYFIVGISLG